MPERLMVSRIPRDAGAATVPAEAWQADHPDHDWWVRGIPERCRADNCPRHPKEVTDA